MINNNICIVGLGYVGLPLAMAFAEKNQVVGYDIDSSRVEELKNCNDSSLEVSPNELNLILNKILFTSKSNDIKSCNIYIITVPTPIDNSNKPDLTALLEASKLVSSVLKKEDIVIYESTVYPGVTEDICVPVLESVSKLKFNQDFFCGYSPERINPGDKKHSLNNIVKVTSGSTKKIALQIDNLYKEVVSAGTYMAPSIMVAEASKAIENTQRDVNIALMNELAMIFNHLNIDTNEVIAAASTKWNFSKFYPGLVGGHCIGVDPYYLSYMAEKIGFKANLILTSRHINNSMGKYVATRTIQEMVKFDKKIKNSTVLILGFSFKEDCSDIRNTKVIDIVSELLSYHINIDIYDPWVNASMISKNEFNLIQDPFLEADKYDAIIVAVAHSEFKKFSRDDYISILKHESPIIDVKNIVDDATWTL